MRVPGILVLISNFVHPKPNSMRNAKWTKRTDAHFNMRIGPNHRNIRSHTNGNGSAFVAPLGLQLRLLDLRINRIYFGLIYDKANLIPPEYNRM